MSRPAPSARRRVAALVALVAVSALSVAPLPGRAAPVSSGAVHLGIGGAVYDLTPDGSTALSIDNAENVKFVIETSSGATTPVDLLGVLDDDGSTVWGLDLAGNLTREIVGGSTTTFENALESVTPRGEWAVVSVLDVVDGQPILFGSNGAAGTTGTFAFDPVARTAVATTTDVDLATSPDGEWSAFVSSDATVIPGLDGSEPRLFRRHVPSGLVSQVPTNGPLTGVDPVATNGGRVLYIDTAPTLQGPGSSDTFDGAQLFAWDGSGVPVQLTTPDGGGLPTGPLAQGLPNTSFRSTPDGTTVVVSSFAENLDGARGGFAARLYRLDLNRPLSPSTESIVQPEETYCFAAVGAESGQFVAVNVTPVFATLGGFGTMHSSDDEAGSTSNVNFDLGTIDPNVAVVAVGDDGEVCFTNSVHGPVHVVADELVIGAVGVFEPPTASGSDRLVDTRDSTPVEPTATRCVAANGEPGDFTGLNVTPVDATAAGFGVVHSSDEPAGATSNVNFDVGTIDPNVAFTKIGTDGQVCFTNSIHGPVDVVIDQLVVAPGDVFSLPSPDGAARLLDSRDTAEPFTPRERRCVAVVGADPGDWVVLNVTPVEATGAGFGTVHSSDDEPGGTSSANFDVGTIDPNVAVVQVGGDGRVCFTNSQQATVHVVLDQLVNAKSDAFSSPTKAGAKRLTDTRLGRF